MQSPIQAMQLLPLLQNGGGLGGWARAHLAKGHEGEAGRPRRRRHRRPVQAIGLAQQPPVEHGQELDDCRGGARRGGLEKEQEHGM